jgi:4a-hydroxytetrahydrobiopterin dehydratase
MVQLLSDDEITQSLADLPNWQRTDSDGDSAITTSFEVADFRAALDLVVRVGNAAEQMDHHPDIDIRWNVVKLVLSTHSKGGLTSLDMQAAHRFNDEAGMD